MHISYNNKTLLIIYSRLAGASYYNACGTKQVAAMLVQMM